MRLLLKLTPALLLFSSLVFRLSAFSPQEEIKSSIVEGEALQILVDYLKIDTSNPPGNEIRAAKFLQGILSRDGIESEIFESAPQRANLLARLEGEGTRRALILLHHLDVVPPDESLWEVPPFGGLIKDGYVWGRGAVDMKSLGVVHLMTLLELKRSGQALNRDVLFLATADEECGSQLGMGWFADNHFNKIEDAGLVLTEGGANLTFEEQLVYVGVETTQKTPVWLKLTVKGPPGHGSVPLADSAAARLIKALQRVLEYDPEPIVVPEVAEYFKSIARFQPQSLQFIFEDIARAIDEDPEVLDALQPPFRALLKNTISLTVLRAGGATNAIPSEAYAELDCRLLPGQDPEVFLEELRTLLADPAIRVEPFLTFGVGSSSLDPEFFSAVRLTAARVNPEAAVGISVLPGFSDSHFFRAKGIPSFGFSPFLEIEPVGIHGHNERISVTDFEFGVRFFYETIGELVYEDPP